jgi:hypothetical protein
MLVVWLVGDHLLFGDFAPCGKIFMNMCIITVAMAMLLLEFWTSWNNIYDTEAIHPWPTMYTYLCTTHTGYCNFSKVRLSYGLQAPRGIGDIAPTYS